MESVVCYRPRESEVVPVHSLMVGRASAAAAAVGQELYVAGGSCREARVLRSVERLGAEGKWTDAPPMLDARRDHALLSVELGRASDPRDAPSVFRESGMASTIFAAAGARGVLFAMGGTNRDGALRGVERLVLGGAAQDGKDGSVGGSDGVGGGGGVSDATQQAPRWERVRDMLRPRARFGAARVGAFIYVVGGCDDSGALAFVERYDMCTDSWRSVAPLSVPRAGVMVAAVGGMLYAVGGDHRHSAEMYVPQLDEWRPFKAPLETRTHAAMVAL
jgi:hypothetical protein